MHYFTIPVASSLKTILPATRSKYILLVLSGLISACGGGGGGGDTPQLDPSGTWSGTTSQSKAIGFKISTSGIVTEISGGYKTVGIFCSTDGSVTITNPAVTVASDKLTGGGTIPSGAETLTVQIDGKFDDSTHANGTLSVNSSQCGSSGQVTWSAIKQ